MIVFHSFNGIVHFLEISFLCRVRLVVSGVAQVRPQPPARRHDLQDELRAPGGRRPDDLRDARRRRRAHGLHVVSDLPRAPPARGVQGLGADARRLAAVQALGDGSEGALLRRHLRQPQDRLLVAGWASPGCATSTAAASARTSSSTSCSTSCCCRCPTTMRTPTSTGRTRRSPRSPPPTPSCGA